MRPIKKGITSMILFESGPRRGYRAGLERVEIMRKRQDDIATAYEEKTTGSDLLNFPVG